jgi:two-component system chemotaxis response regulator CheB
MLTRRSKKIRVIGASTGGVIALKALVKELKQDLPAAILVVQPFPSFEISYLYKILGRQSGLKAKLAEHGERIEEGTIYCSLPDNHLIL